MRLIAATLIVAVAGLSSTTAVLAQGEAKVVGTTGDEGVGDQRIICRKQTEVGSLVRKKKMCFTKAEWDLIAEREQVGVKRTQDELSARSTGN
ncbi:hypothetical protein ACFOMD_06655 [Sphingoaurantiacus capsulatus]|uniref:Secreted protein n=1 Tax=Sphingoaurantiacus capsulatus TaxID=1771310 RepID=A0ABV7X8A0_9SPHN